MAMLQNPLNVSTISGLVNVILKIIVQIGTPVAVIFIVYSGFLFVTARGNPTKLTEAKKAFGWTMVGTAILLGASLLASIIQTTVGELGAGL